MSHLYTLFEEPSKYYDKKSFSSQQEYNQAIQNSSTVYVGNLSITTTQFSIHNIFSKVGILEKIIMGINQQGDFCGFCFVIYKTHQNALKAVQYINNVKLDDRLIRVDIDAGFKEGRQFGRGIGQNQVRDQMRQDFDPERHNTHRDYQYNKRHGNRRNYGYNNNRYNSRDNYRNRDYQGDFGQKDYQRKRQYSNFNDEEQYQSRYKR